MTSTPGSDEWRGEVAAARAEQDRLDVVDGVLFDMWLAASKSRSRKGYAECEVEDTKSAHYEELREALRGEQTAAADRVYELVGGADFVEKIRQGRERVRAEYRSKARGIERSR